MRRSNIGESTERIMILAMILFTQLSPACAKKVSGKVLIKNVPHIRQKPDFCGEACIAMYMQKLGHRVTQDDVFNMSGVDPVLGRGCITKDMAQTLKRIGFNPGPVWHKILPSKSTAQIESEWNALLANLGKGIPSIVCMHYNSHPGSSEHFRLVLGYDAGADEVIYHEPAKESGAYCRMKRTEFLELWPLKYAKDEWLLIRMNLKGARLSVPKTRGGYTHAEYAQHIMKLKPKVPEGFTSVLQPPFVVIGNEPPKRVRQRAEQTVAWFTDRIRKLYFKKDPLDIYDIWLFKDDSSYRKYAEELFHDTPDTPFGYCSDADAALVMNIGTGGGTLCHEIVHAFTAANFPECPSWFNEGLASLYEQCGSRGGRLVGFTNWRLAGLKQEIQAETLPSFKTLISTTTHQFYNMMKGNNYAQARYLCYYLQEKGLLETYYHAFQKNVKQDPAGYETLKTVLRKTDMDAFQKQWENWVLKLQFP